MHAVSLVACFERQSLLGFVHLHRSISVSHEAASCVHQEAQVATALACVARSGLSPQHSKFLETSLCTVFVCAGTYVSNRVSDKITPLSDNAFLCRSGSAADTQLVSDYGERVSLGLSSLSPLCALRPCCVCLVRRICAYQTRAESQSKRASAGRDVTSPSSSSLNDNTSSSPFLSSAFHPPTRDGDRGAARRARRRSDVHVGASLPPSPAAPPFVLP